MISRSSFPLWAGAALGALIAARGIVAPSTDKLPPGVAARVDGRPILRADLERALAAVAADRRDGAVPPELQRKVLDRLIDEELLIARGVALGLPSRDPRVRAELVAAMLDVAARTSEPAAPDEASLRAFYARDPARFARPAWVHVEAAYFAGDLETATRRARAAAASGSFDAARAQADRAPLPLPDGPLPAKKLADYLGAPAAEAALSLERGALSAPLPARAGVWVITVKARDDAAPPPFEAVRDEVIAAFARTSDEARLRRFLDEQRATARIEIAP